MRAKRTGSQKEQGQVLSCASKTQDLTLLAGYNAQQIARIHGPAGLHIGSKRPAEIALSILAQITAIRNNISPQPQEKT